MAEQWLTVVKERLEPAAARKITSPHQRTRVARQAAVCSTFRERCKEWSRDRPYAPSR